MGATRDDFIKYPRTPHLFGSKGTDDDKHLGQKESEAFIADQSLIVEEKIDGTNVGIHFTSRGRMVLQCRGHEITEGMHPQYDLFKQWTSVKRPALKGMLGGQFILYGEWLYAKHSVHYRKLPRYFFEFDIYDKDAEQFLDFDTRLRMPHENDLPVQAVDCGFCERDVIGKGFRGVLDNQDVIPFFPSEYDSSATLLASGLNRSASSKARSGREVLPRCQTTNKSQVASLSTMGTITTFGMPK